MARNERNTESLVRDALRAAGYLSDDVSTVVEEQKSSIAAVRRLLKDASKTGKGGAGAPEFIITDPDMPDILVLIECKADTRFHISAECAKSLTSKAPFLETAEKK